MAVQHNSATAVKADVVIIDEVVRLAKSLRFGQIVLTIHNSRIVQIDKTEKIRLDEHPARQRQWNMNMKANRKTEGVTSNQ